MWILHSNQGTKLLSENIEKMSENDWVEQSYLQLDWNRLRSRYFLKCLWSSHYRSLCTSCLKELSETAVLLVLYIASNALQVIEETADRSTVNDSLAYGCALSDYRYSRVQPLAFHHDSPTCSSTARSTSNGCLGVFEFIVQPLNLLARVANSISTQAFFS